MRTITVMAPDGYVGEQTSLRAADDSVFDGIVVAIEPADHAGLHTLVIEGEWRDEAKP